MTVKDVAKRPVTFLLTVPIVVCPPLCTEVSPLDEAVLLELHDLALKAHFEDNIETLLAAQAESFVLNGSGRCATPTRKYRRKFLARLLASSRFTAYRDRFAPVVRTSGDGSLGWVATHIDAWGTVMTPSGKRNVELGIAWIELYERRKGIWTSVGKPAVSHLLMHNRLIQLQSRKQSLESCVLSKRPKQWVSQQHGK